MPNFSEAAFREVQHRCSNDLQMVAALCSLTAARQDDPRLRDAIREISNRVNILARARKGMGESNRKKLGEMLRLVADGLTAMAEPHGVKVDLEIPDQLPQLSDDATTAASIAVNELATNALKHAFGEGDGGTVKISVDHRETSNSCVICVEDDGIPFTPPADDPRERRRGIGLDLGRRSLAAQGGMLILPEGESKRFEIRLPCQAEAVAA
jgi:two-component sensor histidine kinase